MTGSTCVRCNQRRGASEHVGGRNRVTLMVAQPSGEKARIETLRENLRDKSASHLPSRVIAAPPAAVKTPALARAEIAWHESAQPAVSRVLNDEDWRIATEGWQPRNCQVLAAVADALDEVWRSVVPEGSETEIVLRIVGFTPTVAAFIVVTVERTIWNGQEPAAEIGMVLRYTGIAVCTVADNVTACGLFRGELRLTKGELRPVLDRLEEHWSRAIAATSSETTLDDLFQGLDTGRERVRVSDMDPEGDSPDSGGFDGGGGGSGGRGDSSRGGGGGSRGGGHPGGGGRGALRTSLAVTTAGVDGPSSTATFGEP